MKDLITWSYGLDTANLVQINQFFYLEHVDSHTYIIPVGQEKSTIFFHLLKFIEQHPHFNLLLTTDGSTTIELYNRSYYALHSKIKLHSPIAATKLNVPVLYPATYPIANHFKTRWLAKNQIHEQELGMAIDKVPSHMRNLLFDLATYYIHLNEEAYPLIASLETTNFSISLCHARIKPEKLLIEFFMPEHLILDNRSRLYCEYIRHLFLETKDMNKVKAVITTIIQNDPLTEAEWRFLYTRLYFPSHFYDIVYDILHNEKINLEDLYEQTLHYARLLAYLPHLIFEQTGINIPTSEWVRKEGSLM